MIAPAFIIGLWGFSIEKKFDFSIKMTLMNMLFQI